MATSYKLLWTQRQTRRPVIWLFDSVLPDKQNEPLAIECTRSAVDFEATNLKSFRSLYQQGENVVVAKDVGRVFTRDYKGITVRFESLAELAARLAPSDRDQPFGTEYSY